MYKCGDTSSIVAYRSLKFFTLFSNLLYVFPLCKAVKYTVNADVGRLRGPRVHFQNNNAATYTGFLSLPSSKYTCDTLELGVVVRFP